MCLYQFAGQGPAPAHAQARRHDSKNKTKDEVGGVGIRIGLERLSGRVWGGQRVGATHGAMEGRRRHRISLLLPRASLTGEREAVGQCGRAGEQQRVRGGGERRAGEIGMGGEGGRTHTEHTFGKAQLEICDKTGSEEGIGVGAGLRDAVGKRRAEERQRRHAQRDERLSPNQRRKKFTLSCASE